MCLVLTCHPSLSSKQTSASPLIFAIPLNLVHIGKLDCVAFESEALINCHELVGVVDNVCCGAAVNHEALLVSSLCGTVTYLKETERCRLCLRFSISFLYILTISSSAASSASLWSVPFSFFPSRLESVMTCPCQVSLFTTCITLDISQVHFLSSSSSMWPCCATSLHHVVFLYISVTLPIFFSALITSEFCFKLTERM